MRSVAIGIMVAAIVIPSSAAAQRRGGRPALRPPQEQMSPADSASREQLESQIRQAFARAVRVRVGLTDEQMRRLIPVTQRYEQERRQLQRRERDSRLALGAAVRGEGSPDQDRIAQLLHQLIEVQRVRVQLMEAEQRDLSAIMTPLQRARYHALQEQVRRRIEQMRQRRLPAFEDEVPPRGGVRPPL